MYLSGKLGKSTWQQICMSSYTSTVLWTLPLGSFAFNMHTDDIRKNDRADWNNLIFTSYSYIAHSFILVSQYLVLHFSACMYMVSHFSCSSMNTCILSPLHPTFTFTLKVKHRSLQFFWYICYDWFGSSFEQKFLCNDCIDMVFCVCASVLFTILFHGLAFCYIFRQDGEWLLKLKDFSIKDMVPNDQHRNILELGETVIFRIEPFLREQTCTYAHTCTCMHAHTCSLDIYPIIGKFQSTVQRNP